MQPPHIDCIDWQVKWCILKWFLLLWLWFIQMCNGNSMIVVIEHHMCTTWYHIKWLNPSTLWLFSLGKIKFIYVRPKIGHRFGIIWIHFKARYNTIFSQPWIKSTTNTVTKEWMGKREKLFFFLRWQQSFHDWLHPAHYMLISLLMRFGRVTFPSSSIPMDSFAFCNYIFGARF